MVVDQDKIHKLSLSKNILDREYAAIVLKEEFKSLPVKFAAWDDLHRLTSDDNSHVRRNAALALGSALEHLPEEYKYGVWEDLHSLTKDEDWWGRAGAASVISHMFPFVPDEKKYEAWEDLIRLICDEDLWVRDRAASKLIDNCPLIPHEKREEAWKDLIRLTSDRNIDIQKIIIHTLGHFFKYIPDKTDGWNDIHNLINNWPIREKAISILYYAFEDILEENESAAWEDLHLLITNKSPEIREEAVKVLGHVFSSISNKSAAWEDLHDLTKDENQRIKVTVASAIGSVFKDIPDEFKSNAWKDLTELTHIKDSNVRAYAKHSLGKVCIYKASNSESETDSRNILEEAIRYFEDAAKSDIRNNPAEFCNLFYRSFDAVIFKKISSKKEIEYYIKAAKDEIGNSKSKQKLVEAVEQLAEVIETAHNAKEADIGHQELLKKCSDICNRVDQLMLDNKDNTPAIFEIYRKNKPSFRKNIKELIDEVKEKAKIACKEAQGTQYENVACDIKKETDTWIGANDNDILSKIPIFKQIINIHMSPEKSITMCDNIEEIAKERDVSKLLVGIFDNIELILLSKEKSRENDIYLKELAEIKKMLTPSARQEIVISSGIEYMGTGVQLKSTYPIQSIPKADFKEVLYENPKKSIGDLVKKIAKSTKRKQATDRNEEP